MGSDRHTRLNKGRGWDTSAVQTGGEATISARMRLQSPATPLTPRQRGAEFTQEAGFLKAWEKPRGGGVCLTQDMEVILTQLLCNRSTESTFFPRCDGSCPSEIGGTPVRCQPGPYTEALSQTNKQTHNPRKQKSKTKSKRTTTSFSLCWLLGWKIVSFPLATDF